MSELFLEPARSALLNLDCQTGLVAIYAKQQDEFVSRAANVLRASRAAGMAVFHIQVGFRPNLPEVSPRNRLFSAVKASTQHQQLFQGPLGAIHPALAPEGDDIVVTKRRISAFTGTDLEMILRAKDIDTVVLFGIATSGVVLSTLLHACDADYRTVVIADCCADLDEALHAALIERLFRQRGEVVTATELLQALKTERAPG
jgi:nicotinamidase-related amidase